MVTEPVTATGDWHRKQSGGRTAYQGPAESRSNGHGVNRIVLWRR
jgi:hypothetical protein